MPIEQHVQPGDTILTCIEKHCGLQFIITPDEHKWYKDRGLNEPKRCRKCRRERRIMKEGNETTPRVSGSETDPRK